MTIDRMDMRVDVAPGNAGGAVPLTGSNAQPGSTSPGAGVAAEALRPLILQIVEEQIEMKLRIAGLR